MPTSPLESPQAPAPAIPAVLLARCPGCGADLKAGQPLCRTCGLGVAGEARFWTRESTAQARLPRWAQGLFAVNGLVALGGLAWVLTRPDPTPESLRLVKLLAFNLAALAALYLLPRALLPLLRSRLVTRWVFSTEWSSDLARGVARCTATFVGDKLVRCEGASHEYAQPVGRRFAARSAPLSRQRQFVRWLTSETVAGRTQVAAVHRFGWELVVAPQGPQNPKPTRSEEHQLVVAPDPSNPPAENAVAAKFYSAHLASARPVSELWFALSRGSDKLPGEPGSDADLPEWAHELEAALTAEVAPLILN